MKKAVTTTLLTLGLLTMVGCAGKSGNIALANMENKSSLDSQIINGKSTKEDVKKVMQGDPQATDFDANGHEKWVFTNVRKSLKAIDYVPVANWFVSGTNDTTTSLVVLFDNNGIVINHVLSQAQGESKGGLFQ